jgi:hypothetical protein
MMDGDECGTVGGMSGRGNRSTRRKPAPAPQVPHDLAGAQTQAAALGNRRLTNRLSYNTATFSYLYI